MASPSSTLRPNGRTLQSQFRTKRQLRNACGRCPAKGRRCALAAALDDDRGVGVIERHQHDIDVGFCTFDIDAVRANFGEWPRAKVIVGPVADTLLLIDSRQFAFAHIDMNCAPPEVAAAEFLWPRMVPGGMILLDDYAYEGFRSQKLAMDQFARSKGISILSLPTGQALIVKPPQ